MSRSLLHGALFAFALAALAPAAAHANGEMPPPLVDAPPAAVPAGVPLAPAAPPAAGPCFSPKSDGDCDGPTGTAPVPATATGPAPAGPGGKCFSPKGDGDCDGPSKGAIVANGNAALGGGR